MDMDLKKFRRLGMDFSVSISDALLPVWNGKIYLLMFAFLPQKAE